MADAGRVNGAGFVVAVLTRGESVRSSDGCGKVVGAADGEDAMKVFPGGCKGDKGGKDGRRIAIGAEIIAVEIPKKRRNVKVVMESAGEEEAGSEGWDLRERGPIGERITEEMKRLTEIER